MLHRAPARQKGPTPVKTTRLLAAATAAGALLLSGCGTAGTANTAAIVDGKRITESGVLAATEQVNQIAGQPVPARQVVTQLIIAPTVAQVLAERGGTSSEAAARSAVASVGDPEPYLIDLVRLSLDLNAMTEEERTEAIARIQDLDVEVNPRYGSFDPERGAVSPVTPDWIADPAG